MFGIGFSPRAVHCISKMYMVLPFTRKQFCETHPRPRLAVPWILSYPVHRPIGMFQMANWALEHFFVHHSSRLQKDWRHLSYGSAPNFVLQHCEMLERHCEIVETKLTSLCDKVPPHLLHLPGEGSRCVRFQLLERNDLRMFFSGLGAMVPTKGVAMVDLVALLFPLILIQSA